MQTILDQDNSQRWKASRVNGLLGLSKSFCDSKKEQIFTSCWKADTRAKNLDTMYKLLETDKDSIFPPFDLKFISQKACNTTPIAVLGVKPNEKEFIDLKLRDKTQVTLIFLVISISTFDFPNSSKNRALL